MKIEQLAMGKQWSSGKWVCSPSHVASSKPVQIFLIVIKARTATFLKFIRCTLHGFESETLACSRSYNYIDNCEKTIE